MADNDVSSVTPSLIKPFGNKKVYSNLTSISSSPSSATSQTTAQITLRVVMVGTLPARLSFVNGTMASHSTLSRI
jgi:hypothetical protein